MQPGRILLSCAVLVSLAFPARAAPDEDVLGKAAGYPVGKPANWFFDESVRVGSFSRLDSFLPHYSLQKAASPLPLPKAASEPKLSYRFEKQTWSLDDFLAHQRVTGLMVRPDPDRALSVRPHGGGSVRLALDGEVDRQSRHWNGA